MRIIQINSSNFGSTGNIMLEIADACKKKGHLCYTACPDGRSMQKKDLKYHIYIGTRIERNIHIQMRRITGFQSMFSFFSTCRFLNKVDVLKPDVIHLHNLHDSYINISMLFRYIKKHNIKTVWTLHDCWAFTGHCPHFTMAKCSKWKTGCYNCPIYRDYPQSLIDNSKFMYKKKKKSFTGVKNLTIVTPSQWLADLVKQSFLKEYPVKIIHNGIDLLTFKPTESDFRIKYNIHPKKNILLGVAFNWGNRKGLDIFIELEARLDSDNYQIVLIGTDDDIDKELPNSVISIHRTQDKIELAEIYTAADLFVNPTREEVFGLVNIEANACGTPVLTFKTGGSPECINEKSGSVVECDDIDAMEKAIIRICETRPYNKDECCKQAKCFDMAERFEEYVRLYEKEL